MVMLLCLPALPVSAADDAPTKLKSPNYNIESMFFGNTGTIYSASASVPPVITSGPTVSGITQTAAIIRWTTDKASTSVVFLGEEAGVYDNQIGAASTALTQAHEVSLERLTRGTAYHFKVRSVDVDGNVVESGALSFSTDAGDITGPVITSGPFISLDSASLVTVTWETNEVSSTVVEYGADVVTENAIGRADDLTLFHQVRISGLTPAKAYLWRVKTTDASNNTTLSDIQTLATPNSPFISGFSITDVTLTSAVVQWVTSTASTTVVEYGNETSVYDTKITDETFTTNHILRLSELASGTTYYLRISGEDQAGNLLQSDEKVFATVVIPQLTEYVVSEITAESAVVTWRSSSAVDELLRYEILDHPTESFIGKKFSGGNDALVTEHRYELVDLESSASYTLSLLGKDIFGNQASSPPINFTTLPDSTPPEILNVKSDATIDLGSRQTAQILVSFELSELGKATIEYGPGASGPFDKKVETDLQYSRAKFLVIPGLEPGQTYHYRIVAVDRSGNVQEDKERLGLIPKQTPTLLDLIFAEVSKNFGFLRNL